MNTAKSIAPTPFSERAGRALGRTWRATARLERKASGWLVARDMNANFAKGLLWLAKLALLAVVLYGTFWVALLLAFAFASAWVAQNADWNEEDDSKPEWKEGYEGFGLYDKSDWRIDMGNADGL